MDRRTASHKALLTTRWAVVVVVGAMVLPQLPLLGWLMLLGLAAVFAVAYLWHRGWRLWSA